MAAPSELVSAGSSEERGTDSATGEMAGSSAAWDSIGGSLGGASASVGPEVAGGWLVSEAAAEAAVARSEEHTSELQSPCNLVCRLLLEKKKKKNSLILCLKTKTITTNK